jgi:hypothetical protein
MNPIRIATENDWLQRNAQLRDVPLAGVEPAAS